jgi:hypothetical protein
VTPGATAAIAAVWLAWAFRAVDWKWRLPAALLAINAVVGSVCLLERGFVARYYANDAWRGPPERSVEHPRASFTRLDRAIDFGPAAAADLPLFFLNDVARFNFYEANHPDRSRLPFSIEWNAYWNVEQTETVRLYVRGAGIRAIVFVDAVKAVELLPTEHEAVGAVDARRGWRRLQITVSAPYGADRAVSAGIVDRDGVQRPFGGRQVFPRASSARRLTADTAGRGVRVIADVVMLVWIAWQLLFNTRRTWTFALWAVAILDAFRVALPWAGRLMLLGGGGDPMTYEFHARDILLNGPLMLLGGVRGQAEAFYYQPLYAYFLSLMHLVFGEGFFGIVFVQRLLVWVAAALAAAIARALFGERAARATLAAAIVFALAFLGRLAELLLGEIVFIPLVSTWVLSLIVAARPGAAMRAAAVAGFCGGLATLSRSTLLLAWPCGVAAMLGRPLVAHLRAAILMAATMMAVVSCATLRNWIVAHQFVPVTTGFSVNLYLGNQPPPGVPVHFVFEHRFYEWFAKDDRARIAIEFARHAPRLFAQGLRRKLLYTLGYFDAWMPGAGYSVPLIATWSAAAAGFVLAGLRRTPHWWLPAAIAASHATAVVLIFPHVYGDRLILPLYVLLLPYVGLLASSAAAVVARHSRRAAT